MNGCPNCGGDHATPVERTTVTGCGPKDVSDRWHCNSCHHDFRVEVIQPYVPFGEPISEMFGEPKITTEDLRTKTPE